MTPMLRELHKARRERLQRMKAWHGGKEAPNVVAINNRQQKPITEPGPEPLIKMVSREITPLEEIDSPKILEGGAITIRQIQEVVAKRYKVALSAITSESRNKFIMLPRQIAYTLARRVTGKALPTIARMFGRDHTSIMHGIRRMEERAAKDAEFAAELTQLEWVIMGKTPLPCPCCGSTTEEEGDS